MSIILIDKYHENEVILNEKRTQLRAIENDIATLERDQDSIQKELDAEQDD